MALSMKIPYDFIASTAKPEAGVLNDHAIARDDVFKLASLLKAKLRVGGVQLRVSRKIIKLNCFVGSWRVGMGVLGRGEPTECRLAVELCAR